MTRVQHRSQGLLEENEQQQSKIVDIKKIPSLDRILVNSTPILEEIQQPQAKAMKVDMLEEAQVPQNEEVESQQEAQPKGMK